MELNNYNTYWNSIKGGENLSPRTGRPKIENALKNDIKVRLDDDLHAQLLDYCEKNNTSKADTIRKALIEFLAKN